MKNFKFQQIKLPIDPTLENAKIRVDLDLMDFRYLSTLSFSGMTYPMSKRMEVA